MAPAFTASSTSCCSPLADRISTLVARPPSGAADLVASHARQVEVEHEHVGARGLDAADGAGPVVRRGHHDHPGVGEVARHGVAPQRVVVGDHHRGRRRWHVATRLPVRASVAGPLLPLTISTAPAAPVLVLGDAHPHRQPAPSRPTRLGLATEVLAAARGCSTPRRAGRPPPASAQPAGRHAGAVVAHRHGRRLPVVLEEDPCVRAESPACSRTLSRAAATAASSSAARRWGTTHGVGRRRRGAHARRHAPRAAAAGRPPLRTTLRLVPGQCR